MAVRGARSGVVEFLELETGAVVTSADVGECVSDGVWLDDTRFAVAAEDGTIRVVDARDGSTMEVATGVDDVLGLWWSDGGVPGGGGSLFAVSAGSGSSGVRVSTVALGRSSPARRLVGPRGDAVAALIPSPKGNLMVTQSAGLGPGVARASVPPRFGGPVPATLKSTALVWDLATGDRVGEVELPDGRLPIRWTTTGIHSESSTGVAVIDPDGGDVVWSAPYVTIAEFRPDGSMVATFAADYSAISVTSVPDGELIVDYPLPPAIVSVEWSSDGSVLYVTIGFFTATGGGQISVLKLEPATGAGWVTLSELGPGDLMFSLLDGDGARLAIGLDGDLIIVDTGSGEVLSRVELGPRSSPTGADWSPDGSMLVVSNYDGSVRLVDVAAGTLVGSPLQLDSSLAVAWFVDDDHIAVWNTAMSEVSIVPVGVAAWTEAACAIAGRNLTVAEWEFHLPGRPYKSTCPQWPPGQ